ncbi:MAG: hypothetical protein JNM74_01450 [Myxococcales bacterium]|jgi:hypothetical protein|nr:hypothetical protein [Myxococcales bacterium]
MSMKRSKAKSSGSRDTGSDDGGFFSKEKPKAKTWAEETHGKTDADFAPYTLSQRYAVGALVAHGKFGKGVVTEVDGQKVNVLFEDGPRKLGHAS